MEQQLKQQARQVWYIRLMLAIYLAATTGYLFYTATANFSPILRIFITGVSVIVIDAFNGRLMDASLLGFGKSEKSIAYRQALGVWAFVILTLLAHARFFATTTLTYFSRTPMAAAIVGEVQGDAEINAIETAQGERAARTAKLEKEKNRIANSEARRIREARRQGQSLIDAAINSKGEEVARLYRSGESKWVMSDRKFRAYRDGIRKAREEAARLEAEARMETKAASEAFIASTAQDTAYLSTLNRILENKVARNEQLTGVYNFTLGFLDIAFGVLYWFLSLFLAQFKRKHDIEYESPFAGVFAKVGDRIGDDVLQGTEKGIMGAYWLISSPFTAGLKFLRFIGGGIRYRVIGWVESWANIDLDGNGNIGNKSVNPKVENTDLTTQKVGRMPIGFSVNKAEQKVGETPPTSTDLGTARFTDVGVTPTSPTFTPTFEIVGAAKQAEKVGEKSVELPPTSPDESTDLRPRKTPTIARKSADKAARNADIKKLVDALRTAWKKRYSTYPDLLRQAQERGVTVHINEEIISITKPKPTPKRKK
jgi:hypothetical protein